LIFLYHDFLSNQTEIYESTVWLTIWLIVRSKDHSYVTSKQNHEIQIFSFVFLIFSETKHEKEKEERNLHGNLSSIGWILRRSPVLMIDFFKKNQSVKIKICFNFFFLCEIFFLTWSNEEGKRDSGRKKQNLKKYIITVLRFGRGVNDDDCNLGDRCEPFDLKEMLWEYWIWVGLLSSQCQQQVTFKKGVKSVFGIAVAVVVVIWKKLFYKKYF
jgi:hypothetical protein